MFKGIHLVAMVVLAGAIAGCGGGLPKELPVAKPAHAGTVVPLPNEQGFVEVLLDSAAAKEPGRKAQVKSKIVAYFYGSDGTSAMSPGPTDVKIKIGMGENGRVVDLAQDPKEAGEYASAEGEYPDGFAGQVRANLNGQAVEVPVRIR